MTTVDRFISEIEEIHASFPATSPSSPLPGRVGQTQTTDHQCALRNPGRQGRVSPIPKAPPEPTYTCVDCGAEHIERFDVIHADGYIFCPLCEGDLA